MKRVNTILVATVLVLASLSAYAQPQQIGTSDVYWEISNDTLYLTGTDDMPDFGIRNAPWYSSRGSLTCVDIESGITNIGNYAFYSCAYLTSAIIPNTITAIGTAAFEFCARLPFINIPNSVTTIGGSAFYGCENLMSITINVTSIGINVFGQCHRLASITVATGNTHYCSVDGVLFTIDTTTLVAYPKGKPGTDYIIPNTVTTIGNHAFFVSNLLSVFIPNSVITIEHSAFSNCLELESINIPNTVTTIGADAFLYCRGLTSMDIGNSVTTIGVEAFEYCTGLTSVTIPASAVTIESYAFYGCTSLTKVVNLNPTPQNINASVFTNVNLSACTLKVAGQSVAAYQTEPVWEDFAPILGCYHVDVAANSDAYGAVSGGGFIHEDILRAIPNAGYSFVNWTNQEGEELSTENPFAFTPTQDTVIIGNFACTDATLKSLGISSGTLSPSFHKDSMHYYVIVPYEISSITIEAEPTDTNASLSGDIGMHSMPHASNMYTFTITVTAEDGVTELNYAVSVVRLPNTDATLKSLTVSEGNLTPAFDAATVNYAVIVESTVQAVVLNALTTDENAKVEGTGTIVFSKEEEQKTATLTVTAEDNITTKTYTVTIVRSVGIAEAEAGERVSMYPNPVRNTLFIEASSAIEQLSIYDLNGRMVLTKGQQQENISIDVSSLPSGIYLVRVKTENSETIKKLTIEN